MQFQTVVRVMRESGWVGNDNCTDRCPVYPWEC